MSNFSRYDQRGYRTVSVQTGYGEWAASYDQTVEDEMDLALLESLTSVAWSQLGRAADLGCGTGRTGTWLRERGIAVIDGVDVTPEMLEIARARAIYTSLDTKDVRSSGLETSAYDLVVVCLVDEHLAELEPLYREAARLARPAAPFVLVGYHPWFIMHAGMPTHYQHAGSEPVAIETHVHLLSDHVAASRAAGWWLVEMKEHLIDERWLELKPKWVEYANRPISFAMVFAKPDGETDLPHS